MLPPEMNTEHRRRKTSLKKEGGSKLITKIGTWNIGDGSGTFGALYKEVSGNFSVAVTIKTVRDLQNADVSSNQHCPKTFLITRSNLVGR